MQGAASGRRWNHSLHPGVYREIPTVAYGNPNNKRRGSIKGEFVNRNADSFKAYFAGRFLSQIGSGRVLLLGALLMALTVSVGLVLAGPAGEVRAQETVTLHEAKITVAQPPNSENIIGYSNYSGTIKGQFELDEKFGSIDNDTFNFAGNTYKIQRIFLNKRFDALVIKIDPLLNDSTQDRPTVIIGDETYSVEDSLLELEHYSWMYVELDWQDGDTVTFTLSITPEATTDVGTQSSANVDFASMLGVAKQASASGEAAAEEGGGSLSGWMGWVGAVAAVVVASIGYTAYRVLR